MPLLDEIPPSMSPDVQVSPVDDEGGYVVKNTKKRKYLRLGEQESFLFLKLDGKTTYAAISQTFQQRFHEELSAVEIQEFVQKAKREGLIGGSSAGSSPRRTADADPKHLVQRVVRQAKKQSPLFFRVSLFDPDQLLNWLEPRTRWLFSKELAALALLASLLALGVTWAQRDALVTLFATHVNWKTFVIAWLTTIGITTCHEFGHGLACKRYGGEVREMGFLCMFFTPCCFCNVSDAWLLKNKWQRFLISMAGTYVDLLIWILAVFTWRTTCHDTAVNYVAWIVVTTCGVRVAFNLNPLLRLDGYYALSDLVGVPNLRKRSRQRWMEYVRWLLWGARRPARTADGRVLLGYGIASWFFTVGFLSLMFFNLTEWLRSAMGISGLLAGATLFVALIKKYFKGSLGEEFMAMFRTRRKRVMIMGAAVLGILAFPFQDRASGPFRLRPAFRWELRAPVAGFLREVRADEGDRVDSGAVFLRMEVPELTSQITRKQAEIEEVQARLRRLLAGPRAEEIREQRERVERAAAWRDLGASDLARARLGFEEQLTRLDLRISQARAEVEYRETMLQQSQQLFDKGGLAGSQLLNEKKRYQIALSELQQVEAEKRARVAEGVLTYEGELARREKELADARAALALLEAGSRPEDIDAERAHLNRLEEEAKHLASQVQKQAIISPISGTITTPRLREKIGTFLQKGEVICVVEDLENLEAEIAVSEQYARVLSPGQEVVLKPRAMPFQNLSARVDRVAPATSATEPAAQSQTQNTVTVYCEVKNDGNALCTGMTGFGRIYHKSRPLAWILSDRIWRFFRTEFWW